MLQKLDHDLVKNRKEPFYIFYPDKLKKNIRHFKENFNGTVLYAVKANPSKFIIEFMLNNGISSFDVASLNEVKLIRKILPEAHIYFMNPIKSRNSIKKAYSDFNVKNFAVDNLIELKKIQEETNFAKDLCIHMRIKIPNNYSIIKLSNKFGINQKDAPTLLRNIKQCSSKVGVCFHVGSQCINPLAFKKAMEISKTIIEKSGIEINYLNVGGGFPSEYPINKAFSLEDYLSKIYNFFLKFSENSTSNIRLIAEPGRSLVADCMSVVVKINLRKNNKLFINDGIHGSLNNAGYLNFIYPTKLFNRQDNDSKIVPFSFYGPTCDSRDFMKGPFYLPNSVKEGDWIEIKNMGAYSMTFRTNFNGFFYESKVFI